MLKVRIHEHIGDIDPQRWDAIGDDPLSRHAVLLALEQATLDGVRMVYATIEDERGRPVAQVPFARLRMDGARLTHGLFRRGIETLRAVDSDFMRTALVICGTPLSVGNPPFRLAAGVDPVPVWVRVGALTDELADELGAPWRAFKELGLGDLPAARALSAGGWVTAPSEPGCLLRLPWRDFDDYLSSLRHPYRYKILRSARKLERAGVAVDVQPLAAAYTADAHRLYEAVYERAEVQLERLTPEFFTALGRAYGDRARLIRFLHEGRLVGWVAVLVAGRRVHDLFHGLDYTVNDRFDLYFNQLSQVIRFALDSSSESIALGQSTETAKSRFGAVADPKWTVLRHRRAAVTSVLKQAAPVLFPARTVPARRAFRPEIAEEVRPSC